LAAKKSRTPSMDDIKNRFSQALAQKGTGPHPHESHRAQSIRGGANIPVPRKHTLRRKTG